MGKKSGAARLITPNPSSNGGQVRCSIWGCEVEGTFGDTGDFFKIGDVLSQLLVFKSNSAEI